MMSSEEFNEEVVILRTGRLKEADLWLRFLTPGKGVLTAFAFGGLRSRRRFSGCLEPLSRVLFCIVRAGNKGYYSLREGSLLDRFPSLHKQTARLGMAVHCARFVEAAHAGAQDSRTVYDLLLRTLTALDREGSVPENLPLYFRARLACEYGYRPDFATCCHCKGPATENNPAVISLSRGAASCSRCGFFPDGLAVTPPVLRHMNSVLQADPDDWSTLQKEDKGSIQRACLLLESFVERHIPLVWERGRFRPV